MKATLVIIALLLATPCFAGQGMGPGPGVKGYAASGCTGTIGNNATTDAGYYSTAANYLFLREITVSCSGTATSISARLRLVDVDTREVVFVIYDSGGNRVWYGSNVYDASTATVTQTVTVACNYAFTAGTYRIGIMAEGNSRFYHSSATGATSAYYSSSGFPTPPTTLPSATAQTLDYEVWVTF